MKFDIDDENYIYMQIAKNIKKCRKDLGLTQQEFMDKTNFSRSFVSKIDADNVLQTFSLGTLWTLSRTLGVDFLTLCDPHLPEEGEEKDEI